MIYVDFFYYDIFLKGCSGVMYFSVFRFVRGFFLERKLFCYLILEIFLREVILYFVGLVKNCLGRGRGKKLLISYV